MENHLVLTFFLILVVILIVEMLRIRRFSLTAISMILFSISYTVYIEGVWDDVYKSWSLFFGAGLGFSCVDCMKGRVFKTVEAKIQKKLLWKIPLIGALAANAASRFLGDNWCWAMLICGTLVIAPLVAKKNKILWVLVFSSGVVSFVLSFHPSLLSFFSVVLIITVYIFFRLSARAQEL